MPVYLGKLDTLGAREASGKATTSGDRLRGRQNGEAGGVPALHRRVFHGGRRTKACLRGASLTDWGTRGRSIASREDCTRGAKGDGEDGEENGECCGG